LRSSGAAEIDVSSIENHWPRFGRLLNPLLPTAMILPEMSKLQSRVPPLVSARAPGRPGPSVLALGVDKAFMQMSLFSILTRALLFLGITSSIFAEGFRFTALASRGHWFVFPLVLALFISAVYDSGRRGDDP
jgi:hypothetical protein